MNIGNQYAPDNRFKAAARLHQSKYRAFILNVDFNEYGNRLCDADDRVFGSDPLRQIWRNHLLGLAMIQQGNIYQFYSITLFPHGNNHFHKELPRYRALLTDQERACVFGCTFEKFIASIDGSSDFLAWKEWLKRRYVVCLNNW